ncbi:MAG TPA: YceH family protein [Solirubrobacteraceae bacterium]|jgi:uncharacterized protein YceH (UPF0502 family)|nr:YceH family protein [Solirubrobacteraceae bacterium]
MNLFASELRVLGCLLEKQRTTPDIYPLSLNSLRLACNQSTNRDPVVSYDDAVLRDALHRLERRGYTRLASGPGSRAPKYRHLLAEALPMGDDEQAVMTVLMLRGPQTPGELKQRTERMHAFADLGGVFETLERLIARELVLRMGRRPGQKEERYGQLLGGQEDAGPVGAGHGAPAHLAVAPPPSSNLSGGQSPPHASGGAPVATHPAAGGVEALAERVGRLEREVAELRAALGDGPKAREGEEHGSGARDGEGHRSEVSEELAEGQPEETLEWT